MKHSVQAIPVTAYSAVTACGLGNDVLFAALESQTSHLAPLQLFEVEQNVSVGEVRNVLPKIESRLARFNTRNAQLALATLDCENAKVRKAVQHAVEKYGAHRIGVVIGTSTSGMYETELAYESYLKQGHMPDNFDFLNQHAWGATADYIKAELGLAGPSYVISTACSSSSKAVASAQRMILAGVCDAVIAGGVDSLCQLTLHGFSSLELVTEQPCSPLDKDRVGISLGEGGGLLVLEKPAPEHKNCIQLLGCGESSDAYHMTAPHPDGEGAQAAMQAALNQAGFKAFDIDYLNLHATGTIMNDASEMRAVEAVLGTEIPCSGTKGITGHTLGAAGAMESIIVMLALERSLLPGTARLQHIDPAFKCNILQNPEKKDVKRVMSNNFGFGGNNASLIFGYM